MPPHKMFGTDESLEQSGIVLDYGDFRITIARAGGANKKFERALDLRTKPYRRAIQTETMDSKRGEEILHQVYADSVIMNWETHKDGGWVSGIEDAEGKLLPFNAANVKAMLDGLPDLFRDIQEQANKVALFRKAIQEDEAGN